MKTKKRNMRWVRRVDLIRVTMPSGGFEAPGSTPLLSPPRRRLHLLRALHLIVFSTSSALSTSSSRVLHLLVAFSTSSSRVLHLLVFSISASCFPCRCRATFAGVPCRHRHRHRRGVALRMAHGGEGGCIPASLDASVAFPRRRSFRGTPCRRRISSLFAVALPCWLLSLSRVVR
jgi:hypothetical protein